MLKQLLAAFVTVGLLATPGWVALRALLATRRGAWDVRRELTLFSVALYAMALAATTVMPLPIAYRDDSAYLILNPLRAFDCLTPHAGEPPDVIVFCLANLIGNIVIFLPLGGAVRLLSATPAIGRAAAIALLTSVAIESIQWIEQGSGLHRTVDTADVILNVTGALLGYCLARVVTARPRSAI